MTKKLLKTRHDNSEGQQAGLDEQSSSQVCIPENKVQKSAVFEVTRHIKKSQLASKAISSTALKFE
jgi:hypothetical protein